MDYSIDCYGKGYPILPDDRTWGLLSGTKASPKHAESLTNKTILHTSAQGNSVSFLLSPRPSKPISELISVLGLVDVWKKLKGTENGHTYTYNSNGGTGSSRLYRFYVNPKTMPTISNIWVKDTTISDYECLSIDAAEFKGKIKYGSWKINVTILKEEDFKDDFQDFWDSFAIH